MGGMFSSVVVVRGGWEEGGKVHACLCRGFSSIIGEAKNVLCGTVQRRKGKGRRGWGRGAVSIMEHWQCFRFQVTQTEITGELPPAAVHGGSRQVC